VIVIVSVKCACDCDCDVIVIVIAIVIVVVVVIVIVSVKCACDCDCDCEDSITTALITSRSSAVLGKYRSGSAAKQPARSDAQSSAASRHTRCSSNSRGVNTAAC
jgi:hypothetical protein